MNELNKELKSQAVHLNMCDEWAKRWNKDWSNERMVEVMYRNLDFCLQHHWPANDFIVKHWDLEFLRKSKVFVNDRYSVVNPRESLVLGTSELIVRYNAWNHGVIHIRDNSSAKIFARNSSFAIVHLYENAKVSVEQTDKAKVVLVKHSDKVSISTNVEVKIREEYDYLKA
jgi:hypothetical protein